MLIGIKHQFKINLCSYLLMSVLMRCSFQMCVDPPLCHSTNIPATVLLTN